MGLMSFLKNLFSKKQERGYDPLNMKITDLRTGFVFDYDLKTWQVKESYQYDWGNNNFSYEYKIDSGDDVAFLSVDDDDDLSLSITRKININSIDEDIVDEIIKNQEPPKKILYNGGKYFRGNEMPGYFRNINDDTPEAWTEFIAWDYVDETNKSLICVEQWGEKEFEAAIGRIVQPFEISNIVPNN